MKNDLSFKLLVAAILSGLVLAFANPGSPDTTSGKTLQTSSSWTSRLLHKAPVAAKS